MFKGILLGAGITFALAGAVVAQAPQATNPTQAAPPAAAGIQAAPAHPSASASQAAQSGIRTVDPTTVRMTFYTVSPADMLASSLMDLDVYNLQNEEVGEIEDVIIDEGKTIRALIISVGGFLGIGDRSVAVQPGSVVVTRLADGGLKAVVNTTREELKGAPEFKFENNFRRR